MINKPAMKAMRNRIRGARRKQSITSVRRIGEMLECSRWFGFV
jgi:hypothetical protein